MTMSAALKLVKPGSSGNSKPALKYLPPPSEYLRASLPRGWGHYFTPRRAGRYWGLTIACPTCGRHPPSEIPPHGRWRWLAAHMAKPHGQEEPLQIEARR